MGEMRLHEGEINIPGAERTAVTDFGAVSPRDDGPGLPMSAHGGNISPDKPVIRWMSAKSKRSHPGAARVGVGGPVGSGQTASD